jgi:Na+-transporting NADH:ubiquinone oxidoreductase subunit NqrB
MENVKVQGILKSVANLVKANSNGTMYRTCTVEISGKEVFAKIWEKSFQNGVTVGNTYTVEMQLDGDTVWLTVLNGSSATIATKEDFAHLFAGLTV